MSGSCFPIAGVLTPLGRGAVATIRLCGEPSALDFDAMFRAVNGRRLADQELDRIVFGRWGREFTEDVVVCRVAERTIDIHCHGGAAPTQRILNDLEIRGANIVDGTQLIASTADVLAAELQDCLSRAVTWRTAEYLLIQADGVLRSAYSALAATDWTDAGRRASEVTIRALLSRAKFGVHLVQPWRVVLTGRPNVGKSSLMNALLGYQRSIVFDQPGTTRDVVTSVTAFDGWPVQLSDTAGLRDTGDNLESEGVARAVHHSSEADLVLHLIDVSAPPEMESLDRPFLPPSAFPLSPSPFAFPPSPFPVPPSPILIAHKCDLADGWGDAVPVGAMRVSSKNGEGVSELQRQIVRKLVPQWPPLNVPLPITTRQTACLQAAAAALAANDESAFRAATARLCSG